MNHRGCSEHRLWAAHDVGIAVGAACDPPFRFTAIADWSALRPPQDFPPTHLSATRLPYHALPVEPPAIHDDSRRRPGVSRPASGCSWRRASARRGRAPRAAAACTSRTGRGSPCGARTSRRPGWTRRGPTPRPCPASAPASARRRAPSVHPVAVRLEHRVEVVDRRRSYLSFVEPTWQTIAGGSAASSRYIVYSDVPGRRLELPGILARAASCRHAILLSANDDRPIPPRSPQHGAGGTRVRGRRRRCGTRTGGACRPPG